VDKLTTSADVKRAMQPLLERHDDLALLGRMLIIKPVRHILRFVCIDRRSSPNIFVANTAVNLSFLKFGGWSLSGGRPLYIHQRLWDIRDAESIELLRNMIDEEALPELRNINSIDDFVAHRSKDPKNSRYFFANYNMRTTIAIAKGDLEGAISIIDPALADGSQEWVPKYYSALVARDRIALANFLHEQQIQSIKTLKLEKYWESTPFPLESQITASSASII
jgi:hypothetical protein